MSLMPFVFRVPAAFMRPPLARSAPGRLLAAAIVAAVGLLAGNASRADDSLVPIFDGKSLAGWEGKPEFWRVEEGVIIGETTAENPTKGNTFLIWRAGLVDDFELMFQYRISDKGNSGVQYRSKDFGDFVVGAIRPTSREGRPTPGSPTRRRAGASSARGANASRSRPTETRRPVSRSATQPNCKR